MKHPVIPVCVSNTKVFIGSALPVIVITLVLPGFYPHAQASSCDLKAVAALQTAGRDQGKALTTLAACLAGFDNDNYQHIGDNGDYCVDNAKTDPSIRLANIELRLAAYEGYAGTFCCSTAECAANCPTPQDLDSSTCNADCKTPHQSSLLTTLDPVTRIKNVAGRLLAVNQQLVNIGACESEAISGTEETGTTSGGTGTQNGGGTSTSTSTSGSSNGGGLP